jgi:acyl-coenzyme A thioesterase PaaI-like protein
MSTSLAVTTQEIHQLLDDVAFIRHYGFRLTSIADGTCCLYVPFQDSFERPGGIVSGPVFMAAADVAMWLAIMTKLGLAATAVTVDMTTAFLQGNKHRDFWCTATILKLGQRLVYGVAECVDNTSVRLTHHTLTYARSDRSEGTQGRN